MASSSVRDVFLTPPEENNFNILQNTSDRNRKRNASIASDSGYFSEDSHGHVKISRTMKLPVEPLPGELLPVEPLPENIWNADVGYSPCQSPKLDLEELIQCGEEENGDIRNEEHSEDISVIHENSPLGLPEDPLSGIFQKGRFREMGRQLYKFTHIFCRIEISDGLSPRASLSSTIHIYHFFKCRQARCCWKYWS